MVVVLWVVSASGEGLQSVRLSVAGRYLCKSLWMTAREVGFHGRSCWPRDGGSAFHGTGGDGFHPDLEAQISLRYRITPSE